MAHAKQLRTVDRLAQSLLADAVRSAGVKHADIGARTGLSQNRVSKILRLDTPPATVGEIAAIAGAIGYSAAEIIGRAEAIAASDPDWADVVQIDDQEPSGDAEVVQLRPGWPEGLPPAEELAAQDQPGAEQEDEEGMWTP
ncbi:hypothetical protein CWT12_12450 [Actinomyces sp. 432]|uniref:helix-turn-helix domain-containing protein n=1 Tax=Actinomyces sp. 432 TaxID=2057798 RepID=UPI0013745970|nr:helix-turn-helix transcriptional regulator [Actinomyces sp. 432]QHO91961.1 hypothetical protein CWT12_12450 [Actinomyces sp. 432]